MVHYVPAMDDLFSDRSNVRIIPGAVAQKKKKVLLQELINLNAFMYGLLVTF